jgi:hypothetical protein
MCIRVRLVNDVHYRESNLVLVHDVSTTVEIAGQILTDVCGFFKLSHWIGIQAQIVGTNQLGKLPKPTYKFFLSIQNLLFCDRI